MDSKQPKHIYQGDCPEDGNPSSRDPNCPACQALSTQPAVQVPQDTKTGVDLIAAERARQIAVEGWTPEHDDEHDGGELAMAAALYAAPEPLFTITKHYRSIEWNDPWPWHDKVALCRGGFAEVPAQDKRKTHCRLRALEIAGALIAAEIDRLQRAATPSEGAGE